MGVGTVALTYATVKRWSGAGAGLVAGALVALTPVAALMFRFNNPDALVVLLMTAAAYCRRRADRRRSSRSAVRSGRCTGWSLAGSAIGLAFLTKMFQGLLVAAVRSRSVYLIASSPLRLRTRIGHLLAAARLDDRLRGLVRRSGRAVAGGSAAVHRRLDRQLAVGAGCWATTA